MKAGQVTGIKKAVTLMNRIAVFYHDSSKTTRNLHEAIHVVALGPLHDKIRLSPRVHPRWKAPDKKGSKRTSRSNAKGST